jgi:curved DNA-binding protein CbpA
MDEFEDYYEILRVPHTATAEEIKKAYRELVFIWHPDQHQGAPQSVQQRAEEETKRLSLAYAVLSVPSERKKYDVEWLQKKGGKASSASTRATARPEPIFEPTHIKLKNVKAGEVKEASFLVFNAGGPYSRVRIDSSESWLMITDYNSLTPSDELPLKVNIQALATNWNKTYSGSIRVELDGVKAVLPIELKTKMKLLIKDHKWHDMDYDNLRDWVKTPQNKAKLDAGEELPGKIFRYRLNRSTGKYQIRLRYRHTTGVYEP